MAYEIKTKELLGTTQYNYRFAPEMHGRIQEFIMGGWGGGGGGPGWVRVTIKVVGGQEHNYGGLWWGRCCEGLELQCILNILFLR